MLAHATYGEARADRPALIIAHGLFGSARNWAAIARRLADTRQVVAVDMRNHGQSAWADSQSYANMAGDLAEVIDAVGSPADLLGHSMGGKAAMVTALRWPDRIRKLVVADIAPVAYEHDQMVYLDAMRDLDLDGVTTRGEADARMTAVVPDKGIRAFLLQSLDVPNRAWRLNLEVLAAEMPEIMGFPAIDGAFSGPAMFLSGEASDYVRRAHRDRIRALFPKATMVRIPEAGHWLHAEKPREFEAAVRTFLDR